jgi:hypothetical protein
LERVKRRFAFIASPLSRKQKGVTRKPQRLSKAEIVDLQRQLAQWQDPQSMAELAKPVSSIIFFNQSGLAFLRDAYIASEFAVARKASRVRLTNDIWPDFELSIGADVEAFEAVEADDPNRRRGLEYSEEAIGRVEHDPVENWIARAEAAPRWIAAACAKKAAKNYVGRANLVIYLNMSEYGIRHKEVKASFASATASVRGRFDTIWILWQGQAYRV